MISGLVEKLEHCTAKPIKDVYVKIIADSERYKALLDVFAGFDEEIQLKSDIHGITHVERVCLLGLVLACDMGLSIADTKLFLTACAYHDTGRVEEWEDAGHGKRAADALGDRVDYFGEDLRILKAAIEAHDQSDKKMGSTIEKYSIDDRGRAILIARLLKDADGLDRVRVSDLDPSFLRFKESLKFVDFAKELFWYYR